MTIREFRGKYRPLSNFWYVRVRMPEIAGTDALVYPSTEHAFQAAKSLDIDTRIRIKVVSCAC